METGETNLESNKKELSGGWSFVKVGSGAFPALLRASWAGC